MRIHPTLGRITETMFANGRTFMAHLLVRSC